MGLGITFEKMQMSEVGYTSMTHNMTPLAKELGLYELFWKDRYGEDFIRASELIEPLKAAIVKLRSSLKDYKRFDSPNGWGTAEDFLSFLQATLKNAEQYPDAEVRTDV